MPAHTGLATPSHSPPFCFARGAALATARSLSKPPKEINKMTLDKAYFSGLTSYITRLKEAKKPIFIYGMGDGCLKVMRIFEEYKIACAGIFASDEFVRDKIFCGHRIHKLSEIEEAVDDFIVVLAFGAGYSELIEKIERLSLRHELIVPDMPVIGDGLFTKEYMLENFDKLDKVYSLLVDEKSKEVYKAVIEFKITGNIECLKRVHTAPKEAYENIIRPSDSEVFVDLGAYTGDTVSEFIGITDKKYSHIYACEPNKRNFRKLKENTDGLENVTLVNAAAWDSDTTLIFSKGGGRMPHLAKEGIETAAVSVDSMLSGGECTYIKYDVEGAEREALLGSSQTVKKYAPKLNVALYHRVGDIFELALLVNSLCPEYKLYIRHFPYYPAWDTNLYAVCNSL